MPTQAALQLWPSAGDSLAWVPWNPDDVGLDDYCRVLKRFSPARYANDYLTRNVTRRLDGYHNDDDAVCEWVDSQVWPAVMRAMPMVLSAVYYGAMLAEPVWDTSTGDLRMAALHVCHPSVWWQGEVVRDPVTRELTKWTGLQTPSGVCEMRDRAGRVLVAHWAWGNDFDNAWGDPTARRVYPWYQLVSNMVKWEGVGMETCALPRLIFRHNVDDAKADDLLQTVVDLGANGAIAVSAREVEEITPLTGMGSASPFDVAIRRAYTGIFAAFYEPPLIHSEAQFGTRAQASTQLEAWMGTETAIAEEVAEQVVMDQLIGPAVQMKFGPNADPGSVRIKDAEPMDLQQWAGILNILTTMGSFDPTSEESLNWLAERYGLPMEERKQTAGELPTVAQAGETPPPVPGEQGAENVR